MMTENKDHRRCSPKEGQLKKTVFGNFKTALRKLLDTRSLWISHGVDDI